MFSLANTILNIPCGFVTGIRVIKRHLGLKQHACARTCIYTYSYVSAYTYTVSFLVIYSFSDIVRCLDVVLQLVAIPEVEWVTAYMDFRKTRSFERNGSEQCRKRQRSNWDGPSSSSQLCSKHFEDHCFVTEGVRYRESMGVPALKRLKPDAVPTIFPRSII